MLGRDDDGDCLMFLRKCRHIYEGPFLFEPRLCNGQAGAVFGAELEFSTTHLQG